ncbi:hypothetical protein KKH43_02495 [Patescibacteria group bacterium]|nr:hypothetical protein [Patescibacteria group bacterium]
MINTELRRLNSNPVLNVKKTIGGTINKENTTEKAKRFRFLNFVPKIILKKRSPGKYRKRIKNKETKIP